MGRKQKKSGQRRNAIRQCRGERASGIPSRTIVKQLLAHILLATWKIYLTFAFLFFVQSTCSYDKCARHFSSSLCRCRPPPLSGKGKDFRFPYRWMRILCDKECVSRIYWHLYRLFAFLLWHCTNLLLDGTSLKPLIHFFPSLIRLTTANNPEASRALVFWFIKLATSLRVDRTKQKTSTLKFFPSASAHEWSETDEMFSSSSTVSYGSGKRERTGRERNNEPIRGDFHSRCWQAKTFFIHKSSNTFSLRLEKCVGG